jgi:hypothetical protein
MYWVAGRARHRARHAPARNGRPPWHIILPPPHDLPRRQRIARPLPFARPPRQPGPHATTCQPSPSPHAMPSIHGGKPCHPSHHGGNPSALGECALGSPAFQNLVQAAIMNLCNLGWCDCWCYGVFLGWWSHSCNDGMHCRRVGTMKEKHIISHFSLQWT